MNALTEIKPTGMVEITNKCINFEGSRNKSGYGYTQFLGRQVLAHRLAYALNEMRHPDLLKGFVIRHKCDNPSCINVEHLEIGTTKDNMDDMTRRGRRVRGELVGNSKLTAQQVREIKSSYIPRSKNANQRELAKKYNITQSQISQIISSKRWSHIN